MTLIKLASIFWFGLMNVALAHVVLIDPGHGGEEYGAVARVWEGNGNKKTMHNLYEKDLTLQLSKKVKEHLEKKHTVYLTRSIDRTLGLDQRANMADVVKADIFVSIHFNSSTDKTGNGLEIFYLDNHQDVAVKKVETLENKDLHGAEKVINQILIDLVIEKTVDSSKKLANEIHQKLKSEVGKKFNMRDRGVKPGLFFVLALSKRPGVLIEAGFLSNSDELKKLRTKEYLDQMAMSVSNGIQNYLSTLPPKELPLF